MPCSATAAAAAAPRVPLNCSYHILTSSVIYYWADARQLGIYLLKWCLNLTNSKRQFPRIENLTHVRVRFSKNLITPTFVEWPNICLLFHACTLITFFGKPLQYLRVQLRKLRGKAIHCCTFADIFSSPLKSLAWSLRQRRTMHSLIPYSRAISEFYSTASASVTTLSLKAILYDDRRISGMMNTKSTDYWLWWAAVRYYEWLHSFWSFFQLVFTITLVG